MAFRSVDGTVVRSFFGTPWSNKSDAQPPEGDYMKFVLICLKCGQPRPNVTIEGVFFISPEFLRDGTKIQGF